MISNLLDRLGDKALFRQVRRFVVVSATSASITLGIPILLHELGNVPEKWAVLIAFVIAYLVNFVSLRRIVFNSAKPVREDFVKFALSSLAFRSAEYGLFLVLNSIFHIPYIIALFVILLTSTLLKFFWYRRLFDNAAAVDDVSG